MKTMLFAMCFLFATAAFGQNRMGMGAMDAQAVPTEFPDHVQKAVQKTLGQEVSLLGNGTMTYARGERPLWEVAQTRYSTPLGDIARYLRKEHELAKKSETIWEN